MANHAIVTQSSPSTTRGNLVSPEEEMLDRRTMELLPDRPSRIPPMAPARPAPLPGSAVRIQPPRRTTTTTTTTPTTSPIVVPRVPAPTLPLRQSTTPTTYTTANVSGSRSLQVAATTSSVEAAAEVITLSQPRPDGERVRNEYIDTPLKGGLRATTPLHAETHIHISGSPHDHLALVSPLGSQSSKTSSSSTKSLPFNNTGNTPLTSPSLKRLQSTRRSLPITKQPAQFTKDTTPSSSSAAANCRRDVNCPTTSSSTSRMVFSSPGSQSSGGGDSVICPDCDRCRCLSCRTPRPLPSKWLCGDKCLCSAESCVDYVSCLCCVKGLFYHCGSASDEDDEDDDVHRRRYHHHQPTTTSASGGGGSCADAPCSCVPSHHRMARWGCLASLTLVMPCLLCYWPLQGGVKVVEMCYQKCTRHGCRCDQQHQQQQQRRPNHTSTSSSAQPTGKTAVVVQPLPNSSGKRLLDI
ncbi:protein sprouty-like [Daphnia pulicaria]|uniref:protein sprouty-like n=1 Tax=Daphnia pulicaria TaxID=35523 RepID=UPI001EEC0769|nr:protein sprouty-like [Daphnia pulicaria]